MKKISFNYKKNSKFNISNINFTIKKGESIGIVGPSGSGKSTILNIILGLLKPNSGEILFDDLSIKEIEGWNKNVGYVPQNVYLTDDTIYNNIAFGVGKDKNKFKKVGVSLKKAQLNNFIATLPNKENTIVGEKGVRLSGGQIQRIGIARALYHNPKILVLDEASSALDYKTEESLMSAVNLLKGKTTMIIVTHRLSTVEKCDKIIEIKNGKINKITIKKKMKAVILAGGLGSRLSEETHNKPKPMVEIGGKPILWHIMKIYASHNVKEFIICCGYKGYKIKQYFQNYSKKNTDVIIKLGTDNLEVKKNKDIWNVTLVNTGLRTLTGGRLKRVRKYLENDELFFFTYGDGLVKFNMQKQISFHRKNNKVCTVLGVRPPSRYGALKINKNGKVKNFDEKPKTGEGYINGGYFILSPKCFKYISGDSSVWETNVLSKLVKINQMMAFTKYDFWHPMDTQRDKNILEKMWKNKKPPWKNWK